MYSFIESFTLVTGTAEFDLISLEDLKTALGITTDENDAELARQITFYSRAIIEYLGYPLAKADVVQVFQFCHCETWPCGRALVLSHVPVEAVHSVAIDGSAIAVDDDYTVDLAKGMLYRVEGAWWGGRVEVTYTGGYLLPDEAPVLLQSQVIEAIRAARADSALISDGLDPSIVRSVSHLGVSVTFQARAAGTGGLPAATIGAIRHLRRIPV